MKKIALLFPGQGSQYIGMCKSFYNEFSFVKRMFEEASDAISYDLAKLCFSGTMEEFIKTENTQPSILTASAAIMKVYMSETGIDPAFLAGHSLGELSALTCSGSIEFTDAVRIARARGRLMQESLTAEKMGMAAISGIDGSMLEEECKKHSLSEKIAVVSNYNAPDQVVISGYTEVIDKITESLIPLGIKMTPLRVSAPFHSPLMQQASDKFSEVLEQYKFKDPKWPVISNVTACPYEGNRNIVEMLTKQIVKPVMWKQIIEFLNNNGVDIYIEIGPKNVLRNLVKSNLPDALAYSYDNKEDIEGLKALFSKNTNTFRLDIIKKCIATAIGVKNRNWNDEEYKNGVIEPYRKIKQILNYLESSGIEPTDKQIQDAKLMLESVIKTKKVPENEQKDILKAI